MIDQGEGVPTDPAVSHRTSFREVALKEVFKRSVSSINQLDDGREWLIDQQLEELWDELIREQTAKSLLEANQAILKLLYRTQVGVNELTGEEDPNVRLIDFEHPRRNHCQEDHRKEGREYRQDHRQAEQQGEDQTDPSRSLRTLCLRR